METLRSAHRSVTGSLIMVTVGTLGCTGPNPAWIGPADLGDNQDLPVVLEDLAGRDLRDPPRDLAQDLRDPPRDLARDLPDLRDPPDLSEPPEDLTRPPRDLTSPPDLTRPPADMQCGGNPPHRLDSGTYRITAVSNINDGCRVNPAALVNAQRDVLYDTMNDSLTLFGAPNRPIIGKGALRCDQGSASLPATLENVGNCSYTLVRESKVSVPMDNTLQIRLVEKQTMHLGPGCLPMSDCTSSFEMTWVK